MMSEVNKTYAYVLMRTKHQFCFHWLFKKRYRFFRDAVESVLRQTYSDVKLVILQDSWWRISDKPRKKKVPAFLRRVLCENSSSVEVVFYSCNSHGAAHSLYNIREVLFKLAGKNDDIAIMLDDDDMFAYSGAVGDIVGCMSAKDVCVTQFDIIGQVSMNIVNRGGERHRQLVKQKELKASLDKPFGKGSLCFADSLGWTKTYRIGLLKNYHNDLRACFKSDSDLVKFIRRNDAFEDFPEIINLCRKDAEVVGLDKVTHAYRKHKGSITANPSRRDFVRNRPAYLALLMKLYCRLWKQDKLQSDANWVISRYLVVKILTIENILSKYRSDENLTWSLSNFERGAFMRLLLSVLRKEGLLNDFAGMLQEVDYLEINKEKYAAEYAAVKKNIGDADSFFMLLYRACWNEAVNGVVDLSNVMCDKPVRRRVNMLKQNYYRYFAIATAYLGILPLMLTVLTNYNLAGVEAYIAVLVPFAGWLYSVYRRERDKAEARTEATERFCDSVNELCRHIEAGLCVLYNIRCELSRNDSYRPAKVHFANLKVLSQLSSSEFDADMIIDEFANLPELRVNIRNVDNSAEYMEAYVMSPDYDANKMMDIIEWEIVRYISYITRLKFFTYQKSFILPSVSQLILYVRFTDVMTEISKTIKRADQTEDEIRQVMQTYYERFLNDRNVQREVLNI